MPGGEPGGGVFGRPVAVLVHVERIAHLGAAREGGGRGVVAVGGVGHVAGRLVAGGGGGIGVAVAVAVAVGVPGGLVRGADVDGSFAVVVQPIAHFRARGVGGCFGIVAVLAREETVRVGVVAADGAVTVVVHGTGAVGLFGTRVDVGDRVVAVGGVFDVPSRSRACRFRHRCVTVAVAVRVRVERGHVRGAHIDGAVTVVVQTVADLRRRGVHRGVGIVAVGLVRDVSGERRLAGVHGHVGITEAIGVGVEVESVSRQAIIRTAGAVVVHAITDLGRIRVDRRVAVVAVFFGDEAVVVCVDRHRGVVAGLGAVRVRNRVTGLAGIDDAGVGLAAVEDHDDRAVVFNVRTLARGHGAAFGEGEGRKEGESENRGTRHDSDLLGSVGV